MVTEQEIRETILEALGAKYIGKLQISLIDGIYSLHLYLERAQFPAVTLSIETEDDEVFKNFIYKEMKQRKMDLTKFWRLDRVYDNYIFHEQRERNK